MFKLIIVSVFASFLFCYSGTGYDDFKLIESKLASGTLPSILTFYSQKNDTIYVSINSYSSKAPNSRYSMRIFRDTILKNN
jgi:hypothetical protein